jgi:hypothetical protein
VHVPAILPLGVKTPVTTGQMFGKEVKRKEGGFDEKVGKGEKKRN